MSNKQFLVFYPLSDVVKVALIEFPIIASRIAVPEKGFSDLEIIRLLDNQHYPRIKALTSFIESSLIDAGDIGKRVLDCKDPFQFSQAISELYLFNWLHINVGPNVKPANTTRGQSNWDISTNIDDHEIRFEIYTPIELAGHQLFERILSSLLKYLKLPIGYELDVKIGIQKSDLEYDQQDLFYVYDTGNQELVNKWLFLFEKQIKSWIKCESILKRKNRQKTIIGPGPRLKVTTKITKWHKVSNKQRPYRCIYIYHPTKSSDTKLWFENDNPDVLSKNLWGKKIQGKMCKQQAGQSDNNYTRALVLNFMLADTGWPEFICEDWFTTNFGNLITHLAGESQPYDLVVPAQLGFDCCFGVPAWISNYHKENHNYIGKLGLSKKCEPPQKATQKEIDEILNLPKETN